MQEAKIITNEKEKEEPKVQKYTIGQIVTQTEKTIAIGGNAISEQEALVEILNKLDRLEKNLIGN